MRVNETAQLRCREWARLAVQRQAIQRFHFSDPPMLPQPPSQVDSGRQVPVVNTASIERLHLVVATTSPQHTGELTECKLLAKHECLFEVFGCLLQTLLLPGEIP